MTKKERDNLIQYAKNLSDSELVAKYYDSVYDCLGSDCEAMYELGYDIRDIRGLKSLKNIRAIKQIFLKMNVLFVIFLCGKNRKIDFYKYCGAIL